jgi:hyperosmotically inducible periplasmic protein
MRLQTPVFFRYVQSIRPKEIAMRNMSILRKSIIAGGVMMAFATAPFSLMAQTASPASGMPNQEPQQQPMQQQPMSQQTMQQPASSSSSSSSNETVPGKVDDSWITTKVKSKFAAAKGVKASDISVNTTDGAVTLTGSATSKAEKNRAIHIAKGVKGVKSVDATGLNVGSSTNSSSGSSGSTPPSGG